MDELMEELTAQMMELDELVVDTSVEVNANYWITIFTQAVHSTDGSEITPTDLATYETI